MEGVSELKERLNQEEAATSTAPTIRPVRDRIEALDLARGVALLGIFLVNIEYFARPFGALMANGAPHESGLALALWWLVDVLCEGKFYPLFSLLFGIGLALQHQRAVRAEAPFASIAVRRLAFLATLGLVHGFLLWYGDILFVYAVIGLLTCVLLATSWRALLGVGVAALAMAVVIATFVGAVEGAAPTLEPQAHEMEMGAHDMPAHDMPVRAVEGPPLEVVWQQLRSSDPAGPEASDWQAAEIVAYSQGPWRQAEGFRAVSFFLVLTSIVAGGGLPILAMFLFGAAIVKLDLFGRWRAWLWRLGIGGLGLGLPLAVFSTWLSGFWGGSGGLAAAAACLTVGGSLLAFGYLGLAELVTIASSRLAVLRLATAPLAATGRMALTNYLLQTVIATGVTYHWGLGRFGSLDRVDRVALVLVVFAAQVALSGLWLARFRFGPMEWLWRSFTYGAWQPMRRS